MKHRNAPRGRHRTDAPGRHRADEPLFGHGRHRAPVDLGDRGRRVAATAALLASVGALTSGDPPTTGESTTVALEVGVPTTTATSTAPATPATPAPATPASPAPASPTAASPTVTGRADGAAAAEPAQRKPSPAPATPKVATVKATAQPEADWVDPFPQGRTTSCYGQRWGRLHAGIDRAAAAGTPVRAVGAGRVVTAGANYGGYGISVLIDHGDGYLTHYAHLQAKAVSAGDRVEPGDVIGREGNTGHSTGPHLHFEVHRGSFQNPVNPTPWLRARGVAVAGC